MTKNEIVARWLGAMVKNEVYSAGGHRTTLYQWAYPKDSKPFYAADLKLDYELLHEAWVKFRDLKFGDDLWGEFHRIRRGIENSICYDPITEAFDELVKGIEWYESFKK